jgi:hypothetical protein
VTGFGPRGTGAWAESKPHSAQASHMPRSIRSRKVTTRRRGRGRACPGVGARDQRFGPLPFAILAPLDHDRRWAPRLSALALTIVAALALDLDRTRRRRGDDRSTDAAGRLGGFFDGLAQVPPRVVGFLMTLPVSRFIGSGNCAAASAALRICRTKDATRDVAGCGTGVSAKAHRAPPEAWESAIVRLAEKQISRYRHLAETAI